MSQDHRDIDPDDFFSETRMSFGDHIDDLRTHLMRAVKGFFIACIIGFAIGKQVLAFIAAPVTAQMQAFYDRRTELELAKLKESGDSAARRANQPTKFTRFAIPRVQMEALIKGDFDAVNKVVEPPQNTPESELVLLWLSNYQPLESLAANRDAHNLLGKRYALTTLSVQEAFMVYFKVSLVTGFVLGAPWIFFQVWSFVAVGLYPHEKRLVNVYMPFSITLFILGVLLCEFFVIPKAVEALLWFNEWIGLEPDLRLSEWLGFAIMMPIVFGISFQTPLVMLFVYRIGIMSVASFREKRRIIFFLMAGFAAVITPSTDPYSMLFLWVPLCVLFEVGIWLCKLYPAPTFEDEEFSDSEEVIEV